MIVAILQSTDRHHVNVSTEQRLERLLEIHQVEQRAPRFELDQEVEVTVSVVVTARRRTEQRHRPCVVAAGEFVDLVVFRFDDRTASTHAIDVTPRSRPRLRAFRGPPTNTTDRYDLMTSLANDQAESRAGGGRHVLQCAPKTSLNWADLSILPRRFGWQ